MKIKKNMSERTRAIVDWTLITIAFVMALGLAFAALRTWNSAI